MTGFEYSLAVLTNVIYDIHTLPIHYGSPSRADIFRILIPVLCSQEPSWDVEFQGENHLKG